METKTSTKKRRWRRQMLREDTLALLKKWTSCLRYFEAKIKSGDEKEENTWRERGNEGKTRNT